MKSMRIAVVYLAGGLAGGFALSALLADRAPSQRESEPATAAGAAWQRRMARLEDRLESVIAANTELRNEVENLGRRVATSLDPALTEAPAAARRASESDNVTESADTEDETRVRERSGFERARRIRERGLAEQLSTAGFSQTDAQYIETRVEELRVAAMQLRYEAARGGEPAVGELQALDAAAALRAELGDAQYERFLEATGRPTRVGVADVLSSSAAETAGIQSGDEIVAYGGERVFGMRDLNRVLLDGEPGEPVVVDVVRAGQPIQVVIPRGPLGISSGFGRRGGR